MSVTLIGIDQGGTGAGSSEDARSNLGLVIGSDVQSYNDILEALSFVTAEENKIPFFISPEEAGVLDFLDENDMFSNSSTAVPSQSSVKAYVDSVVVGVFEYKGTIDCSSNPYYPAALTGDVYKVSVAGKIGGSAGIVVAVGDSIYCSEPNGGGSQDMVGAAFNVLEYNIDIQELAGAGLSVNGVALDVNVDDATIEINADTLRIKDAGVTYAKIQNVSASDKLLGRSTAGAGVVEEITCTTFARSILDDADEAEFRATVNLEIGVDVQAYDVELAAIAGLTSEANKVVYFTGSGTAGMLDFKDEDNMASDSATAVPSQQSVKAYVDAAALSFADSEVPSGSVDGSNVTFVLAHTPTIGSVKLYKNGVRQNLGGSNDYTISGGTVTFVTAPASGSVLLADYRY